VWSYDAPSQVLLGQDTLGGLLQRAGYHTAMVGKLHLGGTFARRQARGGAPANDFTQRFRGGPLDLGFDRSFLLLSGVQAPPYAFFEDDRLVGDPGRLRHWRKGLYGASIVPRPGLGSPDWDSREAGPRLTQRAIEFLEEHTETNRRTGAARPFFLFYASPAMHPPFTPPDGLLGTAVAGETFSAASDMLHELDVTVGKLLDSLRSLELLDDTLILFSSDNGAWRLDEMIEHGHAANGTLKGWKGQIWEGGHRIPLVASWGDGTPTGAKIQPGSRSDHVVGLQDVYATLAALVGQPVAQDQGLDSMSFLNELLGCGEAFDRNLLVQGSLGDPNDPKARASRVRMIRDGRWKLIVSPVGDPVALFDLGEDLEEAVDRLGDPAQADRISRMRKLYDATVESDRSTPAHVEAEPSCAA
jgi:arylsulfatase A-like enzyme